jgi:hypothetical protein
MHRGFSTAHYSETNVNGIPIYLPLTAPYNRGLFRLFFSLVFCFGLTILLFTQFPSQFFHLDDPAILLS